MIIEQFDVKFTISLSCSVQLIAIGAATMFVDIILLMELCNCVVLFSLQSDSKL